MKRTSTTLTITSGKGGVGKSVIAVNIAETLADDHSVALLDADPGQGACATMMNEMPTASAMDLVRLDASAEEVLHEASSGLTLVESVGEPMWVEHPQENDLLYTALDEILAELRARHRFVVVDTPGGLDGTVRWALDRADLGALVLVDEPTAITDAYRLAKLVWRTDPAYPLGSIVNYVDSEQEAQSVVDRFATITQRFTGQEPTYLGWIPYSEQVRESVRNQMPVARVPGPVRTSFLDVAQVLRNGRLVDTHPVHS